MDKKIYIAFLWHQHQPYYKDDLTGKYSLPWVRFHAIKDYFDTVAILDEFPKIKVNFNLVPSLLLQIRDYAENGARDEHWHQTLKNVNELTLDDKYFILKNFFMCNWQTMIDVYPRYKKLLDMRGRNVTDEALKKLAQTLNNAYFLDLEVWYNLTWIDPYFRDKDEFIKGLFEKGEHFTEAEKVKLLDKHIEIMRMIIPKYKEVLARKQIEIATSPFYHPILPLLMDSSISKISSPEKTELKNAFKCPEDSLAQMEKGIKYYEEIFGEKPKGVWPSEGSVSDEVVSMLANLGIKWFASDEDILFHSLKGNFSRNDLYNVFKYKTKAENKNINMIFRDKALSDSIGFAYSKMSADAAVESFMSSLRNIKNSLNYRENGQNLISVILDGENCWEYYEEDGNKFLKKLYAALENSNEFETITISEYIEKFPVERNLDAIYPGSWINHNFNIWIGEKQNNKAWELLYKTREFLAQKQAKQDKDITAENLKAAWEEIYIAEGSDWFWWYSSQHNSLNDLEFDMSFRQHLKNVYSILNEKSPVDLDIPIVEQKIKQFYNQPLDFIKPDIDGQCVNFFEWYNAGCFDTEKNGGSMHRTSKIVEKFYYGFDSGYENFYFRIDPSINLKSNGKDIIFVVEFAKNFAVNVKFDKKLKQYFAEGFLSSSSVFKMDNKNVAYDKCLELKIPAQYLKDMKLNKIGLILKVFEKEIEVERWPQQDGICLNLSDKKYIF